MALSQAPGAAGRIARASTVYYRNTMPVMSFKVSLADARTIRARAKARKLSVSEYLRTQALPAKAAARRLRVVRHAASGLTYDPSPGPVVSDEEIRAALADFP